MMGGTLVVVEVLQSDNKSLVIVGVVGIEVFRSTTIDEEGVKTHSFDSVEGIDPFVFSLISFSNICVKLSFFAASGPIIEVCVEQLLCWLRERLPS